MKNPFLQQYKAKHSAITVELADLIQLKQSATAMHYLRRKRLVTHRMGSYTSIIKGRGIDFSEVRNYQFGDDARVIDWRVTARMGEPYIKVFQEERDRSVFLLVDYRRSMFFGTRVTFKSVVAAKAAALFAWAADMAGDRVGAFICLDDKPIEMRPCNRAHGVLPILKTLAERSELYNPKDKHSANVHKQDTSGNTATGLIFSLSGLLRVAHPGSLIVILSDFRGLNHDAEMIIGQLSRHSEIIAGFISDPIEQTPPLANQYWIGNGDKAIVMDTARSDVCAAYRAVFQQRFNQSQRLFKKYRIPLLELSTNKDVTESLLSQMGYIHYTAA